MAQAKESASSRAVDRQLARYRAMRDFSMTAEPSGDGPRELQEDGDARRAGKLPFVIQKHAARRLHYDFRLGWNGVLKSWAVTRGPSYNPADKRLAVQVEDHPIEYGGFEGTIPQGQYGGGTVMVWDEGTWEPLGDVDQGLERGNLKFTLRGKKLLGSWALVRMHGRAGGEKKANWLLIKERDSYARGAGEAPIVELEPKSAITGRDMDQIARANDHVWDSDGAESTGEPSAVEPGKDAQQKSAGAEEPDLSRMLSRLKREDMPKFVSPQLAQAAERPPEGGEWLNELKLDGYRIQLHVRPDVKRSRKSAAPRQVLLLTRNSLDWTERMPDIVSAAEQIAEDSAILDGEVVVLDEKGVSNFADLQAAFQEGKRRQLTYFAFDLLHLNGRNCRELPLSDRQLLLRAVLRRMKQDSPIRLSEHIAGHGQEIFERACAMGAEGIVAKRASDPYRSGRGGWLKIKCVHEQEFVVGGYTLPAKGGAGIGALLLGYYDGDRLIYAGRCGTGFTQKTGRLLRERMESLERKSSAFGPSSALGESGIRWIKPSLVAQIRFSTWTSDGLIRQSSFKGLREDKPAREVTREEPAAGSTAPQKPEPQSNQPVMLRLAGPGFKLSNPDKVLDPESKLTKAQLAEYYLAIADKMLPHLAGRPLGLVRCPEGRTKPCFFQKRIDRGLPAGIESITVPSRERGTDQYVAVSTPEGLLGLAQMGVLEIHPWGSRRDSLDRPDRLIFDLDPDEAIGWETLAEAADSVRNLLKRLGLESFLKTTGGKGLHVVAPIQPEKDWAFVKEFARAVAFEIERGKPELYVTKASRAARKGRIYLDYLRNDLGSSAIAPYSPRARAGAPVALPLRWPELEEKERPQFHVLDFADWKGRLRRDPWKRLPELHQAIRLDGLDLANKPGSSS